MSFDLKTVLIVFAIGTASVVAGIKLNEMLNKAKTVPPPAK